MLPQLGYMTPQRVCQDCITKETAMEGPTQSLRVEWLNILNNRTLLRQKLRTGVPGSLRSLVWSSVTKASLLLQKNAGIYQALCQRTIDDHELQNLILFDVTRTFPNHPLLSEERQQSLRNILIAFANLNRDFRYQQGMSYYAAVLLFQLEEEAAFWAFVALMKIVGFRSLFEQSDVYMKRFLSLFAVYLPRLHRHFVQQNFSCEIFVMRWLRTLFAQQFDLEFVFRLWDVLLVGDLSFAVTTVLAIFVYSEVQLSKLAGSHLLDYLQQLPNIISQNSEEIISLAFELHNEIIRTSGNIDNFNYHTFFNDEEILCLRSKNFQYYFFNPHVAKVSLATIKLWS